MAGLETAEVELESAKLLILSHVAEHFHDPLSAFRRCHELLVPGGLFYVDVPNILSPQPRKRLSIWLSFEHMYYYSALSLIRILNQVGFVVERERTKHYVRVLARKATGTVEQVPARNESWAVRALVARRSLLAPVRNAPGHRAVTSPCGRGPSAANPRSTLTDLRTVGSTPASAHRASLRLRRAIRIALVEPEARRASKKPPAVRANVALPLRPSDDGG